MATLNVTNSHSEVLRSGDRIPDTQASQGDSPKRTYVMHAQPYDLTDVAEMWGSLGQEEGHKITTSDKVEFMVYHVSNVDHENLYIYHDDEGTKGFIFFSLVEIPYGKPKEFVVVQHLFVKKKFRQNGVAKALLNLIPNNMPVQVATPNVAFWKSMGFNKTLTVMEK